MFEIKEDEKKEEEEYKREGDRNILKFNTFWLLFFLFFHHFIHGIKSHGGRNIIRLYISYCYY